MVREIQAHQAAPAVPSQRGQMQRFRLKTTCHALSVPESIVIVVESAQVHGRAQRRHAPFHSTRLLYLANVHERLPRQSRAARAQYPTRAQVRLRARAQVQDRLFHVEVLEHVSHVRSVSHRERSHVQFGYDVHE